MRDDFDLMASLAPAGQQSADEDVVARLGRRLEV
jgi:hypothetical protein